MNHFIFGDIWNEFIENTTVFPFLLAILCYLLNMHLSNAPDLQLMFPGTISWEQNGHKLSLSKVSEH